MSQIWYVIQLPLSKTHNSARAFYFLPIFIHPCFFLSSSLRSSLSSLSWNKRETRERYQGWRRVRKMNFYGFDRWISRRNGWMFATDHATMSPFFSDHVFGNISLSLEFLRPYISLHINRGIDVGFIPGIESWKILFQKLFDARWISTIQSKVQF